MGPANALFFLGSGPILSALYPNDIHQAMGAFKAFYGVGMLAGFLLGSLFYLFGGVFSAFAFMSLLIVIFIPFGIYYVPNEA
jgi:hypothetical protein